MNIADFLWFGTASVGMTLIVVYGKIFQPIRERLALAASKQKLLVPVNTMLNCVQCSGFWCGVISGSGFVSCTDVFRLFLCGCAGSVLAMLTDKVLMFLHNGSVRKP